MEGAGFNRQLQPPTGPFRKFGETTAPRVVDRKILHDEAGEAELAERKRRVADGIYQLIISKHIRTTDSPNDVANMLKFKGFLVGDEAGYVATGKMVAETLEDLRKSRN